MSVLFIFFIYEIFSPRLTLPAAEVCDENCGKSKSYAKLTRTDREHGWPVGTRAWRSENLERLRRLQ